MSKRLTVLITNIAFAFRSGTEIVVDLIARGLSRRGHRPVVFAPYLGGGLHDGLLRSGIFVVNRLNKVPFEPDIIHGQHNVATVMALTAFPRTPALFTCHDFNSSMDRAPLLPRIRRYIAVDESCRDRLIHDGVPQDKIELVYNAVDVDQYRRRDALPPRPRRALLLTKGREHLATARSAATKAGLDLDEFGSGPGTVVDDLPKRLMSYDLVFATARMAKEAMAAGCAVVVCDHRGIAGLATTDVLADWRKHNFGRRLLTHPVSEDTLLQAVAHYNADDAAKVSDIIRAEDNLDRYIDRLEAIYAAVLQDPGALDPSADLKALTPFLEDYLISRDFSRPWTELYRDVTNEAVDILDLALGRHTKGLQNAIERGLLDDLARQQQCGVLDLTESQAHGDVQLDLDEFLSFTTPREQWHYALTIPCPPIVMPSVVEVETQITRGVVGFGLTGPGLKPFVTHELTACKANGRKRIRLVINEPTADLVLVVRNVAADGERSSGIIYRAQVLAA